MDLTEFCVKSKRPRPLSSSKCELLTEHYENNINDSTKKVKKKYPFKALVSTVLIQVPAKDDVPTEDVATAEDETLVS